MDIRSSLKQFVAATAFVVGGAFLGSSAQAVIVTEDLFFNYLNGPEELAGERVLVGTLSYDDAAFEFFDPFGDGFFLDEEGPGGNTIQAAQGPTYDPETDDPLQSLTLSIRLFGVDSDNPNNPEFTHEHDIDFPDFPTLFFEPIFEFDEVTEEIVSVDFVPLFLDYIVTSDGPNGAGALLAAAGFPGGFEIISDLFEVASFDADVAFIDPQPVPVPASVLMLLTALAGFGVMGARRNRKAVI